MSIKKYILCATFFVMLGTIMPVKGFKIDRPTAVNIVAIATSIAGLQMIAKKSDCTLASLFKTGAGLAFLAGGIAIILLTDTN